MWRVESKAMTNFNFDNEIIQFAKYVFNIINCNYSELHVTCWIGYLESKTAVNCNCGHEVIESTKYGTIH